MITDQDRLYIKHTRFCEYLWVDHDLYILHNVAITYIVSLLDLKHGVLYHYETTEIDIFDRMVEITPCGINLLFIRYL